MTSCDLLRTELRRALVGPAERAAVEAALPSFPLLTLDTSHYDRAGQLPGRVRSLDALHVVAALDLGADLAGFVTYDARQAEAAEAQGIDVRTPV